MRYLAHAARPGREGEWSFGVMPLQLAKAAFDQVRERSQEQTIAVVPRE